MPTWQYAMPSQAIVSTGASSTPAWGGPSAVVLTGVTPYDVAIGNSTRLTFISPGSSGGFLISNGLSTNPSFGNTVTTLTATGAITPTQTSGIVGTTTNNNANAGSVGEYICAQVTNGGSPSGCRTNSSTPVSLATGTYANVTSISLTAGDRDMEGSVGFLPAGSTVMGAQVSGISTTSATLGPADSHAAVEEANVTGLASTMATPRSRISVASTTTVYLVAYASFSTSTCTAVGFVTARRVRLRGEVFKP
ncbi:hypothetical protein L3V59_13825 [Burkholderia aenigmatica]|nr:MULTISPECIES: hypothetical protein [Burkholderia]UKD10735.1 hypothetical protein L3V59_13825 [Burkholderia aenigmatica]